MKIREAFPTLLERPRLEVKPDYPLLLVLYLLRMREIDAVPLAATGESKDRAVFGFTSLAKLLTLGPSGFSALLKKPCRVVSDVLPSLSADDQVGSLLDAFARRRVGFAMVHATGKTKVDADLVSLSDLLTLYRRGTMKTELRIRDIGNPTFSLPPGTSIRTALRAMFRRRHRRVFINEERRYISDRDIMDRLFNPVAVDDFESGERDPLALQIGKLPRASPSRISRDESVFNAVRKLDGDHTTCLLTTNDRVVTPWDLVMKPWLSGKLTFEGKS